MAFFIGNDKVIDSLIDSDTWVAGTSTQDGVISPRQLKTAVSSAGSGSVGTTDVLTAMSGAAAGDVGTYAFLRRYVSASFTGPGDTVAGSSLGYNNGLGRGTSNMSRVTPSGTWRQMGRSNGSSDGTDDGTTATLWLRIS